MKRGLILLLLLAPALGAGCARQKGAVRHGLPTGDGAWFEDGIGAAAEDLEGSLQRAGISTVFLPAMRLSRQGSRWEAHALPPPERAFSRFSVFLVIDGDAAIEEALGKREAVGPLSEAVGLAVEKALKDTRRYGPVTGVHLDFPFSARAAEGYETVVSRLRAKLPRGLLLTLSLRFAPSAKERGQFKTLASACDGFVAFLFGPGNRAEPQAVDALDRDWWAGYAPSTRGVWKDRNDETRGSIPEWVLARLLDDPRVEFLQDVSLQEESDQTFLLRPQVPVSIGEGLSFGAGDRIFFRQPLVSDMIFHLRSDLTGRRFARGRVVVLPGRSDSERLFTLAALGDILAGKPAQPVLLVSTEKSKNLVLFFKPFDGINTLAIHHRVRSCFLDDYFRARLAIFCQINTTRVGECECLLNKISAVMEGEVPVFRFVAGKWIRNPGGWSKVGSPDVWYSLSLGRNQDGNFLPGNIQSSGTRNPAKPVIKNATIFVALIRKNIRAFFVA